MKIEVDGDIIGALITIILAFADTIDDTMVDVIIYKVALAIVLSAYVDNSYFVLT